VTMSLVYFPQFLSIADSFDLSKVISLGVYDFLSANLPKEASISIKWPNDMLVNRKKICGILIENVLREGRLNASVIGIGLNVNQVDFPEELLCAVSMKQVLGEEIACGTVIDGVCSFIEPWYLRLRRGESDLINRKYHDLLYLRGQTHEFQLVKEGKRVLGQIEGVVDGGKLSVKLAGQEGSRFFDVREIVF
jgi:BirA family transcriptional regulator, biotin operon repressor / biotin---[acetyl-CoA-carboxylase] ligase